MKKNFAVPIGIMIFLLTFFLFPSEKDRLDKQMAELCKADGGIRVYETVTLPPEMFDRWGDPFPSWRQKNLEDRLGPDYRYIRETVYLKHGDPISFFSEGELRQYNEKIIRLSDGKLLGQSILYGRLGGDMILLGHPSSKRCPVFRNANESLIRSVFLKSREVNHANN